MHELWVNNWGYTMTSTYHKTNLTFREAFYETLKDIRTRTNKNLVVPLSGGSDSALIYNGMKDLGIEVKTVHQRYWDGDRLINDYESKYVDPDTVDIFQDIDCTAEGEFRTSQWLKDIQQRCPTPYIGTIQGWIRRVLNPNHDFLITDGGHFINGWNYQRNEIKFAGPGQMMYVLARKDFEYAAVFNDNPIIFYTFFDQTSRDIMENMSGDVKYQTDFKKILFEHHFPEFDHLKKSYQRDWSWPEDYWLIRKKYGNKRGYVAHCSGWRPMEKLDLFFDCIDNSIPIAGEWYEWNWNLSNYGLKKLQYKIFTDKIEYFQSSNPWSKNL